MTIEQLHELKNRRDRLIKITNDAAKAKDLNVILLTEGETIPMGDMEKLETLLIYIKSIEKRLDEEIYSLSVEIANIDRNLNP